MKIISRSSECLKIELEPGDNRQQIIDQYHHEPLEMGDFSILFDPRKSTDTILVFWTDYPIID